MADDGSYYAEGRRVWRHPRARKTETGTSVSLGFPVCDLHEACPEGAASVIAAALNEHRAAHPNAHD